MNVTEYSIIRQTEYEQCTKYTTNSDCPIMDLRGPSGEISRKAKGDYTDRVHSDQMVLRIVRQGSWTIRAVGKGNSRPSARVHSDQMVLMMTIQGAGPHEWWPKET
jgi:hypothetical protein